MITFLIRYFAIKIKKFFYTTRLLTCLIRRQEEQGYDNNDNEKLNTYNNFFIHGFKNYFN